MWISAVTLSYFVGTAMKLRGSYCMYVKCYNVLRVGNMPFFAILGYFLVYFGYCDLWLYI